MQAHQQQRPIVYFLLLIFIGCIHTPLPSMEKKKKGGGKFCPCVMTHNKQKKGINIKEFCPNMTSFEIYEKEDFRKEIDETIFFFTKKQDNIACKKTDKIIKTFKTEPAYYEKGCYDCLATKETTDNPSKAAALLLTFQNNKTKKVSSFAVQSFDPKNPLCEMFIYLLLQLHNNGFHNNVIAYVPKNKESTMATITTLKQLAFKNIPSKRYDYSVLNHFPKK